MAESTGLQAASERLADDDAVVAVFRDTLAYARENDYRGWDYGDGMSSRLLGAVPGENRWVNLAVQETVKRFPLNLRPLFLVEQRRNYKGTALFAMANQNAHRLHQQHPTVIGAPDGGYLAETESLLDWLVENRCEGYHGFCGSHQHRLQHLDGTIGRPDQPDLVTTSYAVRALLRGGGISEAYLRLARSAAEFLFEDLHYREVGDGAVVNYHLNHPDDVFTINAGALGARLLVDLYDEFGDPRLRDAAERILDHVAGLQTDRGGWYYRDPPSTSHLSMDSHHNGFVIECFQRYAEVVDADRYADTLVDALAFYRDDLFGADGAPSFDEDSVYPRDVHAAAQGILVFTYAGDHEFARRIVDWTVENLYLGDGRFVFRKHRFYTKRHVLMRWCVAWMAYALSEFLCATTTDAGRGRSASGPP